MKGLILKDFYTYSNLKKNYLLMFVIVIAFSFFLDGGSSYIAATLMMFMMMTASTCFNYDESSHWDRYAVALPVSRSKIELSRYVTP